MADLTLSEVDRLQTKEYWDERYQKDEDDAKFDWFKTFADLEPFFRKHIDWARAGELRVIMLGCGNSILSEELYDEGLKNITNVDFAETCIEQMKRKYADRPAMTWHVADVRDMAAIGSGEFDVAIDKGTLDALLSYTGSVWDIPDDIKASGWSYMDEVHRVLKPGGRLLYISYRQPHFARPIIGREYWELTQETIADPKGGFDYFGYVMQQ
ncbi:S-adenosyl-L-methionine-dependent methyltransferase [Dipodascopsis tothii]|uniref:S-adenosyl-L-methionine-dependent methyltransferase n=1 Tax=Dipodascopsis tothii TaxID=44089 RepID=UPI0034CD4EDC